MNLEKETTIVFDKITNHLENNKDISISWNSLLLESAITDGIIEYYTYYGNTIQITTSHSYILYNRKIDYLVFNNTQKFYNYIKEDPINTIFISEDQFINKKEEIEKINPNIVVCLNHVRLHELNKQKIIFFEDRRGVDESKSLEIIISDGIIDHILENDFIKYYIRAKRIKSVL